MKRTPLKRTGFKRKSFDEAIKAKKIKPRSSKRAVEESQYGTARQKFLAAHTVCPVTKEPATQIHHSAKREGQWLNLQRYWIAVSAEGHRWIEDNKTAAEKIGLMVRIRQTYKAHVEELKSLGLSLTEPTYYKNWSLDF